MSNFRNNEQQPLSKAPKTKAGAFHVARGRASEIDAGPLRGAVVAIGNFDGVHRGHRAVIAAAQKRAQALGRKTAALTFTPHPRLFLRPQDTLFQLSSERDKLRLLAATGLDGAIVMTFDARAGRDRRRRISSRAFWSAASASAARPSASISISARTAPARPPFWPSRAPSSALRSTSCRRWRTRAGRCPPARSARRLRQGKVVEAAELLGAPWFASGEVIHGDKRGRELGFPTANLRLDPACGLKHGIYAVRVAIGGKRHDGVASFGVRPMFDNGAPLLEVYLFDFAGDLYGAGDRRRLHRLDPPRAEVRVDRGAQARHGRRRRAGARRACPRPRRVSRAG